MDDLIYYEPFSGQFFECNFNDIVSFVNEEDFHYILTEEQRPLINIIEDFLRKFCEPVHFDRRLVPYPYFKLVRFVNFQLILQRLEGGVECQMINWLA